METIQQKWNQNNSETITIKNQDMKPGDKHQGKKEDQHNAKAQNEDQNTSNKSTAKQDEDKEKFPGYPHYPPSEDIYNKEKEVDTKKQKEGTFEPGLFSGERNEKDFQDDMTGEDLDVPGSSADEKVPNEGQEDEENNYYSIGGDRHTDLERDDSGI